MGIVQDQGFVFTANPLRYRHTHQGLEYHCLSEFSPNGNCNELIEILDNKIATFFLLQYLFFGGGSSPG